MSAASVLSFSPSALPSPVMPVEVAMRLYLSHSPPSPLRGFLSSYEELQRANNRANRGVPRSPILTRTGKKAEPEPEPEPEPSKPLRPCLSRQQGAAWSGEKKKRVVFADSKGMSLTDVHLFSKSDDDDAFRSRRRSSDELQFDLSDLEAAALQLRPAPSLALDFRPPSSDYLELRRRLLRDAVCLENCSLRGRSLSGTVKVRNTGFRKAVQVRVTSDSWASFRDVDCSFVNDVYGGGRDTDTFAFSLELPDDVSHGAGVEFCLRFTDHERTHWDNNDGKNYRLKQPGWDAPLSPASSTTATPPSPVEQRKGAELKSGGGKLLELDLDQFGSPRTSSGMFPGWQSWGHIDTAVPYW